MKLIRLGLIAASLLAVSGCAELVVVGGATAAVATTDRRDVSTQFDDQKFEVRSFKKLFDDDELWEDTNISVISYNNQVLIIGQAPTASLKVKAAVAIGQVDTVKKVYNQIRVAPPTSFVTRRQDDYLTTKIKSSMLFTADFPSTKVKVVTEDAEVFLMGLVTNEEADTAVNIARNTDGVKKVIKVFEYLSQEELSAR